MASEETGPVIEDYKCSLAELTTTSKPMISMLSMLAEDLKEAKAPAIVRCIEQRLHLVPADQKLPILYLMDSICKNVGIVYVKLFTQNIVSNFCNVFEKVDPKTRLSLLRLRQTWGSVFPAKKLNAIDRRIHTKLDPKWPMSAETEQVLDIGARRPETNQSNALIGNVIISRKRTRSPLSQSQNTIRQKSRNTSHPLNPNEPRIYGHQSPTQDIRHYVNQRPTNIRSVRYIDQQSCLPFNASYPLGDSHSSALLSTSVRPSISTTIPAPHVLNASHMNPNVITTLGQMRGMSSAVTQYNSVPELRHNVIENQFPSALDRDYRGDSSGSLSTAWFESDSTGAHTLRLDGQTNLRVGLLNELRPDFSNIPTSETNNKTFQSSLLSRLLPHIIGTGMTGINEQTDLPTDPPIELSSDSLKLKRNSVVSALYKGIQCTNCSLRFDNSDRQVFGQKSLYSVHLDWHFRQNRRDKAKSNSKKTREWYYSLDLWAQFTLVTQFEGPIEPTIESKAEELPESNAIAEKDESLNCCGVCAERFDQKWDEEEEEWILKNAVKHNHILYHPLCLNDLIAQNERFELELNERVDTNEQHISDDQIHALVAEELVQSETNCDNVLTQDLSQSDIELDINMNEMNGIEYMSEEPVLSKSYEQLNNKVINSEIGLNCVQKLKHQLAANCEIRDEEMAEQSADPEEDAIESELNSSNVKTEVTVVHKVVVSGHEVSNLCNIM